jgi:transposase InsO family protein
MQILEIKSPIRKSRYENCTQQDINEKARIVHNNFLARNFEASRPLEKLVTDVSYVYHKSGRLYLSVIKDLYDNSILAYSISKWNSIELVNQCLFQVFSYNWDSTNFCVLHSDQGFQYTHIQYIKYLDNLGVTISHSRKANCLDNSPCENFFSHLKSERLELNVPEDEDDLIKRIEEFIIWYNTDRPQDKLNGMTPFEFRDSFHL